MPGPAPLSGHPGYAVLVSYLSWNLDVDSAVSLPCLCTVNFPHCKHFNELSSAPRPLPTRRQKKPPTQSHESREPKSDAKLQPLAKPAKYFGKKIPNITSVNKFMAVFYRFSIKHRHLGYYSDLNQAFTWTLMPALRNRLAIRSSSSLETFSRCSAGVLRSIL